MKLLPVVRLRTSILLAPVAVLVLTSAVAAQTGSVTGTVTGTDGSVLPSVQVYLPGLQLGTLTNAQGRFLILNVPVGTHEVRAELVGRQAVSQQVDVVADQTAELNLTLESRAISLDQLVVTGVAAETPEAELPFTVESVDIPAVQPVAVPSAASLIRGRIAGAEIIQGSGQPGDEASIQLRGPTSITGNQEPLIIIDGVISQGSLSDIDPLDIASIEVVKGAAAASVYGSRAQAGVVQITTKRGTALPVGETEVTVRTMVQQNDLERVQGVANSHYYRMNAEGTAFVDRDGEVIPLPATDGSLVFDDGGLGVDPYTSFQDNPYPQPVYDPLRQFFNPGRFYSTYASVSGNEGTTQYRASGRFSREEGAIEYHDGLKQYNFRLNVDHRLTDNLSLALSTYYATQESDIIEQGGGGILQDITFLSPMANLGALKDDGTPQVLGDPIGRTENPLFELANRDYTRDDKRLMGGADLNWAALSWLTFRGNVSYDRSNILESRYDPPGLEDPDPDEPLSQGGLSKSEDVRTDLNASLEAAVTYDFGDFTTRSRVRWLTEQRHEEGFEASGEDLLVQGVPRLSLATSTPEVDSYQRDISAEGFFLITGLTYQNKYVLDLLARRDGSSLFGPEERWQNYYRGSVAWRMSQEGWWPFEFITEFKPRYSIGTAGGRPSFDAQYQTYEVNPGQIVPRILGNEFLKPELATERELGLDMVVANRFRVQANYVDTRVEDQLLLVPLPSFQGFESQWQNAGTLESQTVELSLEAALIESPNMLWVARLNVDRTRQKITELGVPPYKVSDYRAGMWIRENEVLGAFYGLKWANNCGIDLPAGADCNQFQVNDDGLLVYVGEGNSWQDGISKDLWGTAGEVNGVPYEWGMPIRSVLDEELTKLGESLPDLNASLFQDFQWGNFGMSVLLDGEWGAQIYHQNRQWACRDYRCPEADQAGKPDTHKKPVAYYGAAGLYARNTNNSWFTMDGDYVKLREVSIRYTIDENALPSLLGKVGLSRATINLSGRNLKTWTDYPGYDPEVGKASFGGSAAIGRIDEYFYPNYRSFGIDINLVF